jgi:D-tyrosyl-tRNA(Tyr) deacylase
MRAVLQRVSRSSVEVEGSCVGRIGPGWLVLLGVERGDTATEAAWIAEKVLNLRAFEDDQGKMNRSVVDVGGGIRSSASSRCWAIAGAAVGPASRRRPSPSRPSGSICVVPS